MVNRNTAQQEKNLASKNGTSTANKHATLKGTAFSVGVVGGVLLLSYIVLYGLYMTRI